MNYDTFINSVFVLQGRADEFTTRRPGERKRILADILGLSIYDALEARVRARRNEMDQDVDAHCYVSLSCSRTWNAKRNWPPRSAPTRIPWRTSKWSCTGAQHSRAAAPASE